MGIFVAFIAVVSLLLAALVGVDGLGLRSVFGIVIPYSAAAIFLVGIIARVFGWARSPVPFNIPTTCGQQRSLSWIKSAPLENPSSTLGVMGRMALEVLAFRSLFRNTKAEIRDGRVAYGSNKWLWLFGLVFHYSFLVIVLRHMRFFMEPVPEVILGITRADGFVQVALPTVYVTSAAFIGSVAFLLARRVFTPQIRYISLLNDYFPLFLILGIGVTGVYLRHFGKTDLRSIKTMMMSLLQLAPQPAQVGGAFYVHLFLVCTLLAYFPFSKLMHMAGVFLSPTRNLRCDSRSFRHLNPWNKPVHVHTYEEYEDEFRDRMRDAGLPLDKES